MRPKRMIALGLLAIGFFTMIGARPGSAFPPEEQILTPEEIIKLSDEDLLKIYIDVFVELEARKTFCGKAGFTPKDYQSFKDIMHYRITLIQEISQRKLQAPPTELEDKTLEALTPTVE